MKINKQTSSSNMTAGRSKPKYIVLHYTGSGSNAAGNAQAQCKYFSGVYRGASADYFIDDGGIWQLSPNPDVYYSWHCGDGGGAYGITNANSIGIEVCQEPYANHPYSNSQIYHLSELVPYLMQRYSISADHVVRHYDASRKQCPWYYANYASEWANLRNQITKGVSVGIIQCQPNMSDSQLWKLAKDGEYFKVVNKSGKVLDVQGGSGKAMANGRIVQAYKDNGTDAQRWKKVAGVGGGFRLVSKLDENYCLDVKGGAVNARKNIVLHTLQDKEENQWAQSFIELPYYGGGYVSLICCKSGYAVDANPSGYNYE